jgi:hypothetical protein
MLDFKLPFRDLVVWSRDEFYFVTRARKALRHFFGGVRGKRRSAHPVNEWFTAYLLFNQRYAREELKIKKNKASEIMKKRIAERSRGDKVKINK